MALMSGVGILLTVPIFVTAYMWFEGRENWRLIAVEIVLLTSVIFLVFDRFLRIPWPPTLVGDWFPVLQVIPTV